MANLAELKALGAALPPSERVMSNEVADVMSAIIAEHEHGEDIVTAAQDGKIADFYHDHLVGKAEEAGTEIPRRGNVQQQMGQSAAPVNPLESKVAALSDQVAALVAALQGNAPIVPPDEQAQPQTPNVTDVSGTLATAGTVPDHPTPTDGGDESST